MNESDAKVALGNVLKGFASRETALTQELERAVGQVQGPLSQGASAWAGVVGPPGLRVTPP